MFSSENESRRTFEFTGLPPFESADLKAAAAPVERTVERTVRPQMANPVLHFRGVGRYAKARHWGLQRMQYEAPKIALREPSVAARQIDRANPGQ